MTQYEKGERCVIFRAGESKLFRAGYLDKTVEKDKLLQVLSLRHRRGEKPWRNL